MTLGSNVTGDQMSRDQMSLGSNVSGSNVTWYQMSHPSEGSNVWEQISRDQMSLGSNVTHPIKVHLQLLLSSYKLSAFLSSINFGSAAPLKVLFFGFFILINTD